MLPATLSSKAVLVFLAAVLAPPCIFIIAVVVDYHRWVAFGTGGTPPNIKGYARMTKFRILQYLRDDDLRDASMLAWFGPSYITGQLRPRTGLRPRMMSRTLPQRQRPGSPLDAAVHKRLHALPAKYAEMYSDILRLDLSNTEGRSTDAIYRISPSPDEEALDSSWIRPCDRILGDEIAHVHPAENSLHVWLAQADARKVIEADWGELFPLAPLGLVDYGWTFIYAPRSMEEVDVIEHVVKAGISHMTGRQIN